MGVRQSMEVAKAVMAFCQQLGTCERIDGIIDDEKFRTQLSDLLAEAPSSFKQFICDAQKPPENEAENGAPVTHRALNSLRISSGPQFDPSLGPELLRWYNDPETIFVGSNAPEDDTSISSPSSSHSSFLASIYLLTNKKRTIDNVRWRLCLIALAKVVDRLEGVYLTDSLVEQVADIVDPKRVKIKNGKAEIRGWLHPLLSAASRYRLLSEELGTGELCCLPPDIGESLWTHYLPKSGEVHDTCVKWLLDRDIEKLSSTIINSSDREVVTVSLAAKNVVEFWRRKLDIFGQRYIQPGRFDFTQAQGKMILLLSLTEPKLAFLPATILLSKQESENARSRIINIINVIFGFYLPSFHRQPFLYQPSQKGSHITL
ncbi:hypothetical protein BJX63DRAFT_431327 [Aspergillus granulosus]|uniref:Uncharacterized protein n=1 Tax=Aspergillus granulosus TaxID=176169 RepID=A0ABR4HFZ9_9EURO